MDQALRDTIQYHVGRGFELETLTPDNRATLVRNGEVLRLRMEGAAVFLQREAQPATAAPPGMPWLAIALLALSLIVALALLIFAVLPQVRGQSGVDSETAATSAITPPAAAAAITATAVSVTATAPPDAGATTSVTPPPAPTLLPVSDQRFAAVATTRRPGTPAPPT